MAIHPTTIGHVSEYPEMTQWLENSDINDADTKVLWGLQKTSGFTHTDLEQWIKHQSGAQKAKKSSSSRGGSSKGSNSKSGGSRGGSGKGGSNKSTTNKKLFKLEISLYAAVLDTGLQIHLSVDFTL
ncbi:hypothetical protein BDQ17DRAFT_1328343 [Cyathus striatus]|nr:hypothetical protein BDQ17DRAFT_1328343 [Cyathus striatus]